MSVMAQGCVLGLYTNADIAACWLKSDKLMGEKLHAATGLA